MTVTGYRSSLTQHIKSVHKAVRYRCSQCLNEFTSSNSLKNHVRSVHEEIELKCDNCDYETSYPTNLLSHKKDKHEHIKYTVQLLDLPLYSSQQIKFQC